MGSVRGRMSNKENRERKEGIKERTTEWKGENRQRMREN
jgi:hypothetical protein